MKIAKGHPNNTNPDHDGFINPGSTVNVMIDVSEYSYERSILLHR